MDISKLSNGTKLTLGGGILALVVSFLHWQSVEPISGISFSRNEWHGWGSLAGIVLLVLLAWELSALFGKRPSLPVSATIVTVLLAALLILFTLLKVLADNEFRTFWAWIGLLLSVVVGVGAWMGMQEAGESLADVKSTVASAASGAAAAARAAAESGDKEASSSTPAPAPPAPAAPPAEPPAAPAAEDEQPPPPA
jgi:protein-S-isoprenylcysteine O-methyltransferase Ste14